MLAHSIFFPKIYLPLRYGHFHIFILFFSNITSHIRNPHINHVYKWWTIHSDYSYLCMPIMKVSGWSNWVLCNYFPFFFGLDLWYEKCWLCNATADLTDWGPLACTFPSTWTRMVMNGMKKSIFIKLKSQNDRLWTQHVWWVHLLFSSALNFEIFVD